jgi:hypothetical protein
MQMKSLLGLSFAGLAPLAWAHEGHGLGANHWHATDAVGFIVLAVVISAALWLSRRK